MRRYSVIVACSRSISVWNLPSCCFAWVFTHSLTTIMFVIAKHFAKRTPGPMGSMRKSNALWAGIAVCVVVVLFYLMSPNRRFIHTFELGAHGYGNRKVGHKGTLDYSMFLRTKEMSTASFWHDVPMDIELLDKQHQVKVVIEIPKGTTAKMEINKEVAWNPIKQDVKNGKLREYPMPSVVHYGAIAQTYEHPNEEDDLTGLVGDGDPVDVLDISDLPARSGDIYTVKVLGALAMKDDDAADWKIITIRDSDPAAAKINDLSEILQVGHIALTRHSTGGEERRVVTSPEVNAHRLGSTQKSIVDKLEAIKTFFRDYKKKHPSDPSPVSFDYNGMYLDAATAVSVIRHHHIHWCSLVDAASVGLRVGLLSDNMRRYQDACDDARSVWAPDLEANEAMGATTGAAGEQAVPEGVWLPIEVHQP